MANQWQNKLTYSAMQPISDGDFPWKVPKLSRPADDDLAKQWCVVYGVWSFDENRIVRKRVILNQPTVEARLAPG